MSATTEHAALRPVAFVAPTQPPGISVVGLDQIGIVAVACLSHLGFPVVGVDIRADRTSDLLEGNAPVHDARLERFLLDGVNQGLIKTSQNLISAVLETDITVLAATPATTGTASPAPERHPMQLTAACAAIGQALALKSSYHVIVLTGDAPLGIMLGTLRPLIELTSGKTLGTDFGLCVMPQFGRGGSSVADFFSPPKTVIGASDPRAAAAIDCFTRLVDGNAIHTSIELAEMAKRADSLWQATRMAFDEDIGRLCAALDLDGDEALDIFRRNVRASSTPAGWTGPERRRSKVDTVELAAVARLATKFQVSLPLFEGLISRKAKA